jgi:hypothetical protein
MLTQITRKFGRASRKGPDYQPLKAIKNALFAQEPPAVREARERLMEEFHRKYGNKPNMDTTLLMNEFEVRFQDELRRNPALSQAVSQSAETIRNGGANDEGMMKAIEMIEKMGGETSRPKKN